MKTISLLTELWRRRLLVGAALLVSSCIGLAVAYQIALTPPQLHSRQHEIGVASARLLVDTPRSIVADLDPSGAASLSLHAQLIADLVASQPIRDAIAREVGIPVGSLAVIPPVVAGGPAVPTPIATATTPPSSTSTLTLSVDPVLPLVTITVRAPAGTLALRLADGSVTALQNYLRAVAAEQGIPDRRRPQIKALGSQAAVATVGPSPLYGVGAAAVAFGFLCWSILFVAGIRRRMRAVAGDRRASALEPVVAADDPAFTIDELEQLRAALSRT